MAEQVFTAALIGGVTQWTPRPQDTPVSQQQTVRFVGTGGNVHLTFIQDSPFPPNPASPQSPAAPLSYEGNPVVLNVLALGLRPGEHRLFPFQCGIRQNGVLIGLDKTGDQIDVTG